MSHPDPNGRPDLTPIQIGEVWENPATGERAMILELPHRNSAGRAVAELTALVGARVVGEHRHPALVERFTVLEGELTVKRAGQTSILREGETAVVEANGWHDWWNAADRNARVRVEITPGERFAHMVETLFGLARLGHTNAKGMPNPLQLSLTAREFSDVVLNASLDEHEGGGAAPTLRRPRADRPLARLSRNIPAALAHSARPAGMTSARASRTRCGSGARSR